MNSSTPDNANPVIHSTASGSRRLKSTAFLDLDFAAQPEWDAFERELAFGQHDDTYSSYDDAEDIDQDEIFDLIRSISDPEHPLTLEQLAVVSASQITVQNGKRPQVLVEFTPTIPHCSMATLIGLSLRVRLLRSLPERFKVDIRVKEGTHQSENAVNKQLNDKERVAAALENTHLLSVVQQCLSTADQRGNSEA
ncbi:iron-sulfur cluster assembly protein CIA2 [Sporobolomyces koalae]|uniref:iron-sulfur cluster assembly protein CIA2 n=1 Tax=Sporobolomyces koalae TaxID=500713 RepID=UPI00316DA9EB